MLVAALAVPARSRALSAGVRLFIDVDLQQQSSEWTGMVSGLRWVRIRPCGLPALLSVRCEAQGFAWEVGDRVTRPRVPGAEGGQPG